MMKNKMLRLRTRELFVTYVKHMQLINISNNEINCIF